MKIPTHIKGGIRVLGLRNQDETIEVLANDDLENATRAIAETACYHGDRGDWWRLWLDAQDALGMISETSLENLNAASLRWLGRWASREQRPDIATAALELYYARTSPDEPASEAVLLASLLLEAGNHERLLKFCGDFQARSDIDHATEAFRIVALWQLNKREEAKESIAMALARFPHSSALWLVNATQQASQKHPCDESLVCCAKSASSLPLALRKYAASFIDRLDSRLSDLEAVYRFPGFAMDEDQQAAWLASRGARMVPTDGQSPHSFGGDFFKMPTCVGCGSLVDLFFTLDLRAEPHMKEKLPCWPAFPLFACTSCCMNLGRNDFEVDWLNQRISWLTHELSPKKFGSIHSAKVYDSILPKRFVSLNWLPPVASIDEIPSAELGDFPQAGGQPNWVQYPERLYCPRCHDEMQFYGALGSTDEFKPHSIFVNEFLYHFACNRCDVISVLSQCT